MHIHYLKWFFSAYVILILILFRFVLYQLSKNLNRPFFVDFLTHLSIRYTETGGKLDDEDPEETGQLLHGHAHNFSLILIQFAMNANQFFMVYW